MTVGTAIVAATNASELEGGKGDRKGHASRTSSRGASTTREKVIFAIGCQPGGRRARHRISFPFRARPERRRTAGALVSGASIRDSDRPPSSRC